MSVFLSSLWLLLPSDADAEVVVASGLLAPGSKILPAGICSRPEAGAATSPDVAADEDGSCWEAGPEEEEVEGPGTDVSAATGREGSGVCAV